jgi:hypothetical protein
MGVSRPFDSPLAYQAAVRDELPVLTGVLPGDAFHQFHFSADLPGGSFWGFSGYAIVRAGCIVHAEITSHDN